ncbi:MAG: hypothetical protein SPJ34_05980 [Candidatus Ornithospirochaeta sp.]|nr:hypothetical protein [Candidatus Ornithospirochaeta sp.]
MGKDIRFGLSLKEINRKLLSANPFGKLIPLKIVCSFGNMPEHELEILREYANAEDGRIERWLLVPSSMTLLGLGLAIDKAFGLNPGPYTSDFVIADSEDNRDSIGSMLDAIRLQGIVFSDDPCEELRDDLLDFSFMEDLFLMRSPTMVDRDFEYEDVQKRLRKELAPEISNGIIMNGKRCTLDEVEASTEMLFHMNMNTDAGISALLMPDLAIGTVLAEEGRKVYKAKDVYDSYMKNGHRLDFDQPLKPFAKELVYIHACPLPPELEESMEADISDGIASGFSFHITRPSGIESLFRDGYLRIDEYIDSISYVSSRMLPDCICKKGYDLFGLSPAMYYAFIKAIHSDNAQLYMQDAVSLGWREPFLDLKKVLREKKRFNIADLADMNFRQQ